MNYPNSDQKSPESFPPAKKPFPTLYVVLGSISLLIVLAILGGIRAFKVVSQDSSETTTAGNRFIDSMGQHNYTTAHSMFTPQIQAKTPASSLKDVEGLVEKHYGAYVNHGEPEWNVQNWNGQTSVRLAYPVRFKNGVSTVSLILVQTPRGYQVYDAHYSF